MRAFLLSEWKSVITLSLVTAALLPPIGLEAAPPDTALPTYEPDANVDRSAIPEIYTWDLSPLFASDEAWDEARLKLLAAIPGLEAYDGKLADPGALGACLDLYFRLHSDANFVTLYANLRQSTALSDEAANAMVQSGLAAMDQLMRAASFIRREILTLPAASLDAAYAAEPALATYRPYLDNLRRRSGRLLTPDAERALSLLGDNLWAEIDLNEIPSSLEDAFGALLTDIHWPKISDEKGEKVQLTLSNYSRYRASADRSVRRAAVEALFGTLRRYEHTLAATLAGQFELDVAYARARGYDTALEAYLDKDDIAPAVYDNLVSTINANLPLLHRYVELRKKALGLDAVHLYDLYIPMVEGVEVEVPFSEARATILAALEPLGADYGKVLAAGLDPANGWMDLYPHRDKRSGAFSASVYGPHPYVFMNYQDSLNDMSTLAHEFGHALHSELAMKAQPYSSFRYAPFLAEIASTCNESLLSDYLVSTSNDSAEKVALLVERLEGIRTTIFRQTMFAEFERTVHGFVEDGVPLTAALLEKTYRELVQRYYGPGYTLDEDDGLEWAYIPHFYYKYYVYSYATGLSSGIAIADRVKTLGKPAADAFLAMLAGGASAPPLELLAGAGVDLTKPDALKAAMETFEETLDEVEKLLEK
ncbi:MAG: oligoendopeptidase F [Acidobacteria bacterium]|nr:oligoendopeptidase F [Acidobacteriota bacterium]